MKVTGAIFAKRTPVEVKPPSKRAGRAGDAYRYALMTGKVKPKPSRAKVAIGNQFLAPRAPR